jgi:lauroyl/myristoyl acyltransferase
MTRLPAFLRRYDPVIVARLLLLLPAAWTVPPDLWPRLTSKVTHLTSQMRGAKRTEDTGRIPPALARIWHTEVPTMARQAASLYNQELMQILRCYRPGGWLPSVRLTGTGHIDDALSGGRGAVLWMGEFAFMFLLAKVAFWRAGLPLVHLSRPNHGFANQADGLGGFNRLQQELENRFLSERVVIDGEATRAGMRRLKERLLANDLVSISVGREALQVIETPFLDGHLSLATGPLNLCRSVGAPLLPVMLRRHGPDDFEVCVRPPLPISHEGDRQAALNETVQAYAAALTEHLDSAPFLWTGWWDGWKPGRPEAPMTATPPSPEPLAFEEPLRT